MRVLRTRVPLFCLAIAGAAAAAVPSSVHPSWNLIRLRPANLLPMVGGMEFLSDGRLVIGHWGGQADGNSVTIRQYAGKVYLLSGVTGDSPNVTFQTFADSLEDLQGLTVVNDTIYVSGGNNILRLPDANRDGRADRRDTIFILPGKPASGNDSLHPVHGRSEWMYGLVEKNGTFYANPSAQYDGNSGSTAQVNPHRGVHLSVTRGNGIRGNYEILSMGLRHPTGITFGPSGTLWTADIQGEWLPTNKLIHLQPGKFYGHHHTPAETWDTMAETPAAVLLPQPDISNCPGQPLYIPNGVYAGQFFMGDVVWGGVQRFFVEKVQNQYQGCAFVWSGGLEGGVYRMAWGPDSMLYLGMLGGTGHGGWSFGLDYGLQKVKYGNRSTFEMLAVRSRPAGMEIEFTEPVDSTTAKLAASWQVQTYYFQPTSSYGGGKQGSATLTPSSILLSPDRMKVYLALPGLAPRSAGQPQRIVYIRLLNVHPAVNPARVSWTPETWYTLNALGSGNPFDPPTAVEPGAEPALLLNRLKWSVSGGNLRVQTPWRGAHEVRLRDVRGAVLAAQGGSGTQAHSFPLSGIRGRFVVIEVEGEGGVELRRTVVLP